MPKDVVVSLRLDEETAAQLRELAERSGVSVSDLLRAGARKVLKPRDELDLEPIGYRGGGVELTGRGIIRAVVGELRMRPIYDSAHA